MGRREHNKKKRNKSQLISLHLCCKVFLWWTQKLKKSKWKNKNIHFCNLWAVIECDSLFSHRQECIAQMKPKASIKDLSPSPPPLLLCPAHHPPLYLQVKCSGLLKAIWNSFTTQLKTNISSSSLITQNSSEEVTVNSC